MKLKKLLFTYYPKQYGFALSVIAHILLPIKLLFFKMGFNIFFSNKNQDEWIIKEVFNYKKNGYFIDLAATDGIHESNTFFLEKKLNWSGICIEPNASFFQKLKKNRSVKCLNLAVADRDKKVKFFENGGVGGIIGKKYDNNYQKRSKILKKNSNKCKIKFLKSTSLSSILKKQKSPKTIVYLSLDVEGAETEVIKKFPFKKYKFLAITIERPSPIVNKILLKNGYLFVKNHKVDTIYIHKTLQKKIKIKHDKFEQLGKKQW